MFAPMARRLLAAAVFTLCAGIVFWFALVHTVHRGTLAVPELRSSSIEDARQKAHDLGLEMLIEEPGVFSSAVEAGTVASQEPPPGFHVKAGSKITVRVSLGGEQVAVPDVRESSLSTAEREVEQAGLATGVRARVEQQGGADRVIASGPPVGSLVPPGGVVDLLVNTSPASRRWVMPPLVSRSLTDVQSFCRANRLRLGQAREVAYPGLAPGIVLRQHPPAGSPVTQSDVVTVWVSR
jgi:beta-lactam-binding protein with PASTA domain